MTIDAKTRELIEHCAAEAPAYTSQQIDTLRHHLGPLVNLSPPAVVPSLATTRAPAALKDAA
jgi:hypothetical protein